ncbi:MAG: hypothetical protein J6W58_07160 [Lachnospiraceae bacterium]|nr:hypothetical protein [Lachnospiraceae bacterium]MBP5413819.1 hypothetical protein [Lachnospiraceae bacterium]MBP5746064.1 hypothetical protein [Lachnospiraceae bacterium]
MKYSDKEAMQEIMKRSKNVSIKRIKQTNILLSVISCMLFISLVTVIAFIPNGSGDVTYSNETVYGSFLIRPQTGAYVLVAVLAFLFGVVISILFNRMRKMIERA